MPTEIEIVRLKLFPGRIPGLLYGFYDCLDAMDLMKKGDPIGEWLGRRFLEPLVNHFLPTPEDKKRALETIQRDDPLIRLGMSQGPPEVWKSLLWWGIFVVGMSLAWYMSFHQK